MSIACTSQERKEANTKDSVNMEDQSLSRYTDTSEEELMTEENELLDWNCENDTQHNLPFRLVAWSSGRALVSG